MVDARAAKALRAGEHITIEGAPGLRLAATDARRKCTWTLLSHLCLAIAEHGRPDAIRTDNEGTFGSRRWATALRLAGIRRERIPPKCPWRNGCIERFFGTLRRVLRQLPVPPTAAALQGTILEDQATGVRIREG